MRKRNLSTALYVTANLLAVTRKWTMPSKCNPLRLRKAKSVIWLLNRFFNLLKRIIMNDQQITRKELKAVNEAKGLAKWLKIELRVSIFGVTIIEWTYPPQSSKID